MEKVLRELNDTELDAVSGGASASAANVNTSTDTSFAIATVATAAAAAAQSMVPGQVGFNAFSVTLIGAGAAAGSA